MTPRKLALSLAAASVFALSAGSGQAATITNTDNTFTFSGFDWSKAGAILIDGYDVTSATATGTVDSFTLYYIATAANLFDGNGNPISAASTPGLYATGDGGAGAGAGSYEYTIVAAVQETVTCISDGVNPCGIVSINVAGGDWKAWYDTTPDAQYSDGSGFTNGDLLLTGNFTSGTPVVGAQGATNPSTITLGATFFGTVLSTNGTFIVPDLTGTTASSTLQFGGAITTPFTLPSSFPLLAGGTIATDPQTNSHFGGQADANQSFTVPEPTGLALLGAAIAAIGLLRRRRT